MLKHWEFDRGAMRLLLLDQRKLPEREEWLSCGSWREAAGAIRDMAARGAPLIGVTAAFACVLAAREAAGRKDWREWLSKALDGIESARPTAVNLAWAARRMRRAMEGADSPKRLEEIWLDLADQIAREDEAVCRRIGRHGQELIQDGDCVLTHCNAGALACSAYGTALGVIRAAVEAGKKVSVIADETRPLLQGARLTAYELARDGVPVAVACDNACAALMAKGLPRLVITGADRIAANGDTANKIGTLGAAIMAKYFNIPFYVAAPLSTFDPSLEDGSGIPIEIRGGEEVTGLMGRRLAPEGVPAYNFAFDVTPAELISGIITEKGIVRPPYKENIKKLFTEAEAG